MTVPLEDEFNDIIGKAQRGFFLDDAHLARKAGISEVDLGRVQAGHVLEEPIRKLARALALGEDALVEIATKTWTPAPVEVVGLKGFTSMFHGMSVNAYLIWDEATLEGAVFDTGADATEMLREIGDRSLRVSHLFLTHTHQDHVAAMDMVVAETRARVWVGANEGWREGEPLEEGQSFEVGRLRVSTRETSGHSAGGMTYLAEGLARPVAVVGDALFAGSMGGGKISYTQALRNNRMKIMTLPDETVLCPGHGPMTSVGEEKRHNPFFPEYQKS